MTIRCIDGRNVQVLRDAWRAILCLHSCPHPASGAAAGLHGAQRRFKARCMPNRCLLLVTRTRFDPHPNQSPTSATRVVTTHIINAPHCSCATLPSKFQILPPPRCRFTHTSAVLNSPCACTTPRTLRCNHHREAFHRPNGNIRIFYFYL